MWRMPSLCQLSMYTGDENMMLAYHLGEWVKVCEESKVIMRSQRNLEEWVPLPGDEAEGKYWDKVKRSWVEPKGQTSWVIWGRWTRSCPKGQG